MVRGIGAAIIASLFLGAVMALGDYAWATLHIQHRVGYGLAHGAIVCLCLGVAIGIHVGRPLPAAAAGPFIGVIAAGVFYLLAPQMRMIAMFPAWMAFWILFALLQMSLRRGDGAGGRRGPRRDRGRPLGPRVLHAISGIWTGPSAHEPPNAAVHFAAWTFAFLPGFLALFWRR